MKLAEISDDPKICRDAEKLASNEFSSFEFILSLNIWHDIVHKINLVSKNLQSEDMRLDVAIASLKGLVSFFEKYRENGFTSSMIDAKELDNEMDIEPIFLIKRRIKRNRQFDDNPDTEREQQFPLKNYRTDYFLVLVDMAILYSVLMEDDYSSWIGFLKSSKEYVRGIKAFMENSFPIHAKGEEMKCPCKVCVNRYWHTQTVIYDHLICSGPSPLHIKWICEVSHTKVDGSTDFMDSGTGMDFEDNLGEMFNCTGKKFRDLENDYESLTNAEARKFYGHVREGKQPLYPESTKFSRLSFLIKLYHLKCAHGISESAFGELLELIRDAFPDAQIPLSLNAAKNMIKDLGLHYEKIHACRNNCMLYWGENKDKEKCDNCGVSRWVLPEKKGNDASDPGQVIHKVPANVMRYFPLNPRLQRLYMCKEYSKLMKWHDMGRQQDGKVRHPADTEAWKMIDADYPDFSLENRNVSLGVASDGFNPYRSMNLSHSTWPIVLVNYNLPPWLCMKQENLILSTLISGPDSPKNSIDVFMQPLISELKELWEVGVNTYDALADEDFNLRARVLWTISDFPGYAMLSGWSTKAN
ncbi:uncharacterized protein LOC141701189 [Apium graveolens]|uniref:uncharacterized protein LOC141701189 n=1 Tax=Apium graveolens TaxID=4045 RepID=UPI003D7AFE67